MQKIKGLLNTTYVISKSWECTSQWGVQDQAQCGQHDQLDYASISRQGIWENPQHRLWQDFCPSGKNDYHEDGNCVQGIERVVF